MNAQSLVGLLIIGLVVSGCAGESKDARPTQAAPVSTVATFTPETGGIEGIVLDEEVLPVVGATVGIVGNGTTLQTSAEGKFAFSELLPGSHKVAVEALGFKSVVKSFDVVAGNVTQGRITLESVPVNTRAPNVLTPANNVLWLHTNNAERQIWMNDTHEASDGETVHYGVNAIAFAAGTGTVDFSVPLLPELPQSVPLDKSGEIHVLLHFGGYFTGQDHGKFTVTMELMNGDTQVFSGAAHEVTMVSGEGAKIEWSGSPEVDVIDKEKGLSWEIHASGPSMGYSIRCAGTNVDTCERSYIALPVAGS